MTFEMAQAFQALYIFPIAQKISCRNILAWNYFREMFSTAHLFLYTLTQYVIQQLYLVALGTHKLHQRIVLKQNKTRDLVEMFNNTYLNLKLINNWKYYSISTKT